MQGREVAEQGGRGREGDAYYAMEGRGEGGDVYYTMKGKGGEGREGEGDVYPYLYLLSSYYPQESPQLVVAKKY